LLDHTTPKSLQPPPRPKERTRPVRQRATWRSRRLELSKSYATCNNRNTGCPAFRYPRQRNLPMWITTANSRLRAPLTTLIVKEPGLLHQQQQTSSDKHKSTRIDWLVSMTLGWTRPVYPFRRVVTAGIRENRAGSNHPISPNPPPETPSGARIIRQPPPVSSVFYGKFAFFDRFWSSRTNFRRRQRHPPGEISAGALRHRWKQ